MKLLRPLQVPAGSRAPGVVGRLALGAHFAAAPLRRLVALGADAARLALFPDRWADVITATSYAGEDTYFSERHNAAGLFEWERAAVDEFFPARGTVLVGSEELGLSPEALRLADAGRGRVNIPLGGAKRSLNVSVAFGILIHAWRSAIIPRTPGVP